MTGGLDAFLAGLAVGWLIWGDSNRQVGRWRVVLWSAAVLLVFFGAVYVVTGPRP